MNQLAEFIRSQRTPLDFNSLRVQLRKDFVANKYELEQCLNNTKIALPLISALKDKGVHALITLLSEAGDECVRAFSQLNADNNEFKELIDFFLIDNKNELANIRKERFITFLRHPKFEHNIHSALHNIEKRAAKYMSDYFLLIALEEPKDELNKLKALQQALQDYPFPIDKDIFWIINELYSLQLKSNPSSFTSHAYIELVYDLFQRSDLKQQIDFFKHLQQDSLFLIINHCLYEITSGDASIRKICTNLLQFFCCQATTRDSQFQLLLRKRLLNPDSYLFADDHNLKLPVEWPHFLLSSPRFVADSPLGVLRNLIERFKLQTLFDCNQKHHKEDMRKSSAKELQKNYQTLSKITALNKAQQNDLVAKKISLTLFDSDEQLGELFASMECNLAREDGVTQKKVRGKLDHLKQKSSLRIDLLLSLIDNKYTKDHNSKQESTLRHWQKLYLPHYPNAWQFPSLGNTISLYDAEGNKLGFLSETNEALCMETGGPRLLSDTNAVSPGEAVYNKDRSLLGHLSFNGLVRMADPLLKELSAYYLATVPIAELEQSKEGLLLLVEHVLFENTLTTVFCPNNKPLDAKKHRWLERQFAQTVAQSKHIYAADSLWSLVEQLSDDTVFSMLAVTSNWDNGLQLFFNLMNRSDTREMFLDGSRAADVHQFLNKHSCAGFLAEYIKQYGDRPWFAQGLSRIAFYAKKYNKSPVLSDALAILNNSKGDLNNTLEHLLCAEPSVGVVLREFVNDTKALTIQSVNNQELDHISTYFNPHCLITAVKSLNRMSQWEESWLYRLTLHMLHRQHSNYFAKTQASWQSEELHELSLFVSRHWGKKRDMDQQNQVGRRLLGDLVFRTAQLGQIALFYNKKILNPRIARLSINNESLIRLIDKFYISPGMREQTEQGLEHLLKNPALLAEHYQQFEHIKDWALLLKNSESSQKQWPLICVYLFNFSGAKAPLMQLLSHYFTQFGRETAYLHPVSQLMHDFPQRDVSAVIFDALLHALIRDPLMFDRTILNHMAFYFATKNGQDDGPVDNQINMLTYLGQNKQYKLVEIGCTALMLDCNNAELRKRLARGMLEATVEHDLSKMGNNLYSSLIKAIKRLWNYGFNAKKYASQLVKFCDDPLIGPKYKVANSMVAVPSTAKANMPSSFQERKTELIKLLAVVNQAKPAKTTETKHAISHSVFKLDESAVDCEMISSISREAVY